MRQQVGPRSNFEKNEVFVVSFLWSHRHSGCKRRLCESASGSPAALASASKSPRASKTQTGSTSATKTSTASKTALPFARVALAALQRDAERHSYAGALDQRARDGVRQRVADRRPRVRRSL